MILDLKLPPHSGLDLLKLIRENEALRDMPAVMLTGGAVSREDQTTLAQYKAHVFYKPRSYEALTRYRSSLLRPASVAIAAMSSPGSMGLVRCS